MREEESIDVVARRLLQHNISGAPVVNAEGQVVGIVTTGDMTKLLRGNKQ
jgi:CBS domain-containing protein